MKCEYCNSEQVVRKGFRKNLSGKKQKWFCHSCEKWFVHDDGFKRMRKPKEVIVRAIHQYNDGLSLSKVKNHLHQHDNVDISRAGILHWVNKYSAVLKKNSYRL